MADISGLFKSEIIRLSKKVTREYLGPIQSATASHRHQLATLKKQVQHLEREIARLRRTSVETKSASAKDSAEGTKVRFVAKGLKSLRSRLGLGAEDFGLLLGVSGQSVYNWEHQKTVPRQAQVASIAQLRALGKREARARLESLNPTAQKDKDIKS